MRFGGLYPTQNKVITRGLYTIYMKGGKQYKLYDKLLINRLGKRYAKNGGKDSFVQLTQALIPMIDAQLGRQYSSMKEFWDDLRQEIMLKLWDNRKSIKDNSPGELHQYFYNRIRTWLNRSYKQTVNQYDMFNPNIISIEELERIA